TTVNGPVRVSEASRTYPGTESGVDSMKLLPPPEPDRIGGGGLVVSASPLPTVPEIAVTLVKPGGTVAPPSAASEPSFLSASPEDTATTLLKPAGTLRFQPETVPSLRNIGKELNPPPAIPATFLPPVQPTTVQLLPATTPP